MKMVDEIFKNCEKDEKNALQWKKFIFKQVIGEKDVCEQTA